MFKKVLVALDGSELAARALKPAYEIAEKSGGEIILLRVALAQQVVVSPISAGALYADDSLKRDQEESEAYLQAIRMQELGRGVPTRIEVVAGSPPELILDVAEANGVDLIVMSTHGRSGLSRLLYGSVAESVLRGARVPLLLIPIKS
jgi:nucleotide-binding universal stress UspA family protein